jgi:hypothetical protein
MTHGNHHSSPCGYRRMHDAQLAAGLQVKQQAQLICTLALASVAAMPAAPAFLCNFVAMCFTYSKSDSPAALHCARTQTQAY